ncbi:uncharacterized protein LOC141666331 [Apium graveolens]|uniref:uncharacterized protein LOC141666331 n=1 Tax=Apium graveolens TaxID=4045 RepID=UPI003D7BDC7B
MAFGSRRNFEDRFKSQNTQNRHNFGDTRRTNSFFCDHCKMTGHTMQRCYKLHGYPPNGRNDKRQAAVVQISDEEPHKDPPDNVSFTAAQYQQILKLIGKVKFLDDDSDGRKSANMAGKFCFVSSSGTKWIVDSGATDRMCCDLSLFKSHEKMHRSDSFITIPNGKQVRIDKSGVVELNHDIVFKDVLYVPEFKFNLVSIPKICRDMSCTVTFTNNDCFLQGPLMRPQLLGSFKNGLYYLEDDKDHGSSTSAVLPSISAPISACKASFSSHDSIVNKTKLWHLRLGHMPISLLHHVGNIFSQKLCGLDGICQICPLSRQTRNSFPTSVSKSIVAFQLIHVDTWGPNRFSDHNGCKYFMTIVDDFTRMTWVFLMKFKYEIVILLQNFIAYIKKQFKQDVQIIRTDNAMELCEGELKSFYHKHEPRTYLEASKDPRWVDAMHKELDALHKNHTWNLVPLPVGKKAIGCKWVYKIKLKANGTVERFKARLVAKGYNQKWGIDFLETFSPVVKMATIRCLIVVVAHNNWSLSQLDVNNVFLHGDLCEEVYMLVPDGLENPLNLVCKLVKSLYGLKQTSRQWFSKLVGALKHKGFLQSKNDYSLFLRYNALGQVVIVAVYVDDIIITVGYWYDEITLSQTKFAKELLLEAGIVEYKTVVTPLPLNLKLQADEGEPFADPTLYKCLVGKLNFLTHTRHDLAFTVQHLSQFLQTPREAHFKALQHVSKYVASTVHQGILLNAGATLTLQGYSDSDWGACVNTRRSITGYIILLGKSPISWKSKKLKSKALFPGVLLRLNIEPCPVQQQKSLG